MDRPYELLTKAQVIREYHYPRLELDTDVAKGTIPAFKSSEWGRWLIPRYGVEARIKALAEERGKKLQH